MAILVQLLDDVVVHRFQLEQPELVMGRGIDCDVMVDDSAVSGQHAKLSLQPNAYFSEYLEVYVEDLDSTNGTWLNEQPLVGRQRMHHNDVLRLAWNRFKLIDDTEAEMERTVHMIRTRTES